MYSTVMELELIPRPKHFIQRNRNTKELLYFCVLREKALAIFFFLDVW
jgi:hypothetical protein